MNTEPKHPALAEPAAPAESAPSRSARPIMIAAAVVGGIALLTAGASAAFDAVNEEAGTVAGDVMTSEFAGLDIVRVEVEAAAVTIVFDDVEEVELGLDGPRSNRWFMDRRGDALVVGSNDRFWDFCFGFCRTDEQNVVLTLPRELESTGIDIEIDLAAGEVIADGAFGDLSVEMGAGKATITGEARSFGLDLGAGSASIDLANVREADFDVAAGTTRAAFTGSAPREVALEVSAGSLQLELPDVLYRLDSQVSAGTLDSRLRTSADATREISAEVAAGRVTLTPSK